MAISDAPRLIKKSVFGRECKSIRTLRTVMLYLFCGGALRPAVIIANWDHSAVPKSAYSY